MIFTKYRQRQLKYTNGRKKEDIVQIFIYSKKSSTINSHFYELERQELIGYGQVGKREEGKQGTELCF